MANLVMLKGHRETPIAVNADLVRWVRAHSATESELVFAPGDTLIVQAPLEDVVARLND